MTLPSLVAGNVDYKRFCVALSAFCGGTKHRKLLKAFLLFDSGEARLAYNGILMAVIHRVTALFADI